MARITPDPKNANKGTQRGRGLLERSLREYGAGRSVLADRNGVLIAGNKTHEVATELGLPVRVIETDGHELVVVQRTDLDLSTDKAATELGIADNRTSEASLEWDVDVLAELAAEDIDLSKFWHEDELETLLASVVVNSTAGETAERASLADRFGVPPFSVLDARQGYWQERKRRWLAYGIQSELGRGENDNNGLLGESEQARTHYSASPGGSPRPATRLDSDGKTQRGDGAGRPIGSSGNGPARTFGQDLMRGEHVVGKTAELDGYRVQEGTREHTDISGTSIFDPVLCELAYRWFCPAGGTILDPFAGGSVRGIVASLLGREYVGVDLSGRQLAANEEQAARITPERRPRWIEGDSAEVVPSLDVAADLVFSCPPYADLEVYSDDPCDISTMPYETFLAAYRAIIAASVARLRDNRFACFVVGDVRDGKGLYRNFVSDTIAAFHDAGARLYNEAILVTAVGSLPIRVGKQFASGRKLGKTHQNVLVFIKGDPRKAADACGVVDVELPDAPEEWDV